ncbi:MAG TPA: DUF2085 domain-containing protein [Chloroflexia bacterium]|nr:DUF2085 domain-containing protein [Chloroflexia bacterium]
MMRLTGKINPAQQKVGRWPRALSIHREDSNLALLGKVIVVFVFLGPILVPILWLSGLPIFQNIALFGWDFGRGICSYTQKSLQIGGLDMMVCTRCFGVACGLLTTGLLYFYTPLIRRHLPQRRLYLAAFLAALFVPWLIDSGLERLNLWQTDHWLMFPTGFLGGVAVVLAPLVFWPRNDDLDEDELDHESELSGSQAA